ncbi:hypothetical protein PSCICE_50410 [Pseudomonas cichorii]|nr:hypothetical protein PSCICE_50410 [Pseudomonas cichorii]
MQDGKNCDKNPAPTSNNVGNVLRAGCNSPPAVMARNASSPRALGEIQVLTELFKVSRPGVIPGPTVIVRMKRERDGTIGTVCKPLHELQEFMRLSYAT